MAVELPLFVLMLGESSVSLLFATAAVAPKVKLLNAAAMGVTGLFQKPPGSFVGQTVAFMLIVLFASSAAQVLRLQALRSTFMSSDSSENVATQAVTVEKLLSVTHTAYMSGFNLLLLLVLRALHTLVATQRRMEASTLAMQKQAAGLQAAYSQLSDEKTTTTKKKGSDLGKDDGSKRGGGEDSDSAAVVRSLEKEKEALLEELKEAKSHMRSLKIDNEALVRQSEGQSESYKRLVDSHMSLREQMQEADEYMLIDKQGKKEK